MNDLASRYRVNSHALRALRRLSGKTQADLALDGQITHSYVSRLERGQRLGCTFEVLQKLAASLGVPVSALVAANDRRQ